MSPLAHEIYRQLLRHLRAGNGSITYGDLAEAVSKKAPTHHRSPAFHEALGEVTTACRNAKVPCIPAIVWRAAASAPGGGYFKVAHPRAKTDEQRLNAWKRELALVITAAPDFPPTL